MSTPVPRRIALLSFILLFAFSVALPRLAGAVEPAKVTSAPPVPGTGIIPAPEVPGTDTPPGSSGDDGHPTDIDQIAEWIRNVIGLNWPPMH